MTEFKLTSYPSTLLQRHNVFSLTEVSERKRCSK